MGTWMNDDDLFLKFGTDEGKKAAGGEYRWNGPEVTVEFDIIWNELEAFGTTTFLSDTLLIPNGVHLRTATFTVTEAFDSAGDAMTLTFGLYDTDRTTAYDADGIDVTIAQSAIDAVGDVITCDGALVNTILANNTPSYVTALVGTASATAGVGKLRLTYYVPAQD